MVTIYNCDISELIVKTAEELKKVQSIKPPVWAQFVKTGVHKERPPVSKDWWYIRAASVLIKVYRLGPIGISKLRTKYGGKQNRGVKPEHFFKGSGSIARKIVQQLETEGFLKKDQKENHKGRVITAKGKKFLGDIAAKISKIDVQKAPEAKKEVKVEAAAPKAEKKPEEKEIPDSE
jgi:small subunit ribosomal protein S19e